jgi:hypothetical protein
VGNYRGVQLKTGSTLRDSIVSGSGLIGVGRLGVEGSVEAFTLVRVTLRDNRYGAELPARSVVLDSQVVGNDEWGIQFEGPGCMVKGSLVFGNGSHGIEGQPDCVIEGNNVSQNGEDGVRFLSGSQERAVIRGNVISLNGGYGINCLWFSCGFGENVLRGNTSGEITSSPLEIGTNVCGSNTTCP